MHRFTSAALGISLVLCTGACGDDPVSYSAPVGINLKAKSADTVNGVVSDEKGIKTESGNPYGAFVNDARKQLGRDPGVIDVERVELFLGAGSTGVTALGEVFTGTVDVLFQMNDTNNSYPVAAGTIPRPPRRGADRARRRASPRTRPGRRLRQAALRQLQGDRARTGGAGVHDQGRRRRSAGHVDVLGVRVSDAAVRARTRTPRRTSPGRYRSGRP